MVAIRTAEATGTAERDSLTSELFSERFLIRRPLLDAMQPQPGGPPVLLIDEIDRTDEPFEAFLLEALSDYQVTIPELGTVHAEAPPIVILTSNRTREVHDALKRRCLYHWVDYPSLDRELAILQARAPEAAATLGREVVAFVQRLRSEDLFKKPGVAETIDWARCLVALDAVALSPEVIADTLGALLKYQDDIARIQGVGGDAPARRGPRRARRRLTVEEGRLAENIAHFARALRKAGVPVGTGRVVDAIRAVEAAGFSDRADFYHALQACFVSRPEQRAVFAQVFRLFWRDPAFLERLMSLLLPMVRGVNPPAAPTPGERRAAEALADAAPRPAEAERSEVEVDATLTFSGREALRHIDFEQMSAAELAVARRAIAGLTLPVRPIPSRRTRPDPRGRVADWRGTMRAALRSGGDVERLVLRARRTRWPSLVALCDISGSMTVYSRMLLTFLHAAANAKGAGWAEVHAFTFGTRLTNVTRHLRQKDADAALAAAGREAEDWDGGTRIGASLHAFNRDWSRRVLSRGAVVLLITDGLDRDDPEQLSREMERLHLSARRLIWLNPLLRWDGFEPKARGIRAILPHVDSFRPCHDLASLEAIAAALSAPEGRDARVLTRGNRVGFP